MQQTIVFTLWTVVALVIQTVLLRDFPSAKIWTDLLFYIVVILGLRFGLLSGVLVAAIIGYVADATSMAPYGTALISYIVILLLIRKVKANIYFESRIGLFFWVTAFSFLRQIIQLVFLYLSGRIIGFGWSSFGWVLVQSIWEGGLGIFLLPLLEKLLFYDYTLLFRRKGLRS